ncbi:hypothetical protein LCGC14_2704830, partial [marine sediment metagenome]
RWAEAMLDEALAAGDRKAYEQLMARWERPVLAAGLKRFAGNQARMAEQLGMHRTTLRKRLRAHGLIDGDEQSGSVPD